MEDLKKQIAAERSTLQFSLEDFLVPRLGQFNENGLNGLVDVGSSKYKTLESNMRAEYNIMEGLLNGKIGMWDFINGARGQAGPPTTFGSGLSSKYPQYDIYNFVRPRLNGGNPATFMKVAQETFDGVWFIAEDDKASSTASLRLESDSYTQYASKMNAKLDQITNAEAVIIAIMGWGNPLVGAEAIHRNEQWNQAKIDLQNSITNATASATRLKDLQAELNYYTDISSAEQLRSVLLGTGNSIGKYKLNTGLEASDADFLNGTGTLTAGSLEWTAGKEGLNLDKIAGKNGDPVAQERYIHDAYGLLVRNNTSYTPGGSTAAATSSTSTSSDGVKTAFMVSGDEFVSALAVLSRSQYEIERDEYFAAQEASVGPGGQKADKREILDDREQFFSDLIQRLSKNTGQNIEFEMYQTVVSDYMGKGKIVDQLFELNLEQQRKAQIGSWDAKEKDFHSRKQEWVQNIQYLQDTGNARFNDLTGVILKQWDNWRSDFRKEAKEGEEAHLREIEKAIKEKSSWEKDFLSTMKDQDDSTVLRDAYNQIQGMIESFGGTLPTGVSINLNANTILNSVLADSPSRFDEKLVSEGAAQDVQFFINQLQTTKLDEKNVKAFEQLRNEMDERSQKMVVLQTLDSLYSIPKAYEETIKSANEDLHKQLKSQLAQDQFMPVGNVYIRQTVGPDGNPQAQVLPDYTDFVYSSPDALPKVKDSSGKEWDLTDFNTLAAKVGPTSAELQTMVRLAQTQMDLDFKRIYDPENPANREIAITALDPVAVAKVAQAAQAGLRQLFTDPQKALEYTNADERGKRAMEESAMNSGYLVGPTEGGKFGDHHFSQFYTILKLKEKYNEMKQEGESLKGDGFSNAVGSVMEASTFGVLDGKMVSKFMHDNKDVVNTIATVAAVIAAPFTGGASLLALAAYNAIQGAYDGGALGAIAGAASAYSSMTGVDVSYSYADGFGANVGLSVGKVGTLGLSYSEQAGFGASASVKLGSVFSAGVNYTQNGGFGVDLGITASRGALQGTGLNLSYNEQNGFGAGLSYTKSMASGVKGTGSLSWSDGGGFTGGINASYNKVYQETPTSKVQTSTLTGGLTFNEFDGFGGSLNASYSETDQMKYDTSGRPVAPIKPIFPKVNTFGGGLSWSETGGFTANADIGGANAFSYSKQTGIVGNENFGRDFWQSSTESYQADMQEYAQELASYELEQKKSQFVTMLKQTRPELFTDAMDDNQVLAAYKKVQESLGQQDGSRDNVFSKIAGDLYDDMAGALGYSTNAQGYVDEKGQFHARVCFVAGTKIHTKDGLKNIEEIQVGDIVLSKNDKTGEVAYKRVSQTYIRTVDSIYKVEFADGLLLETTWSHPFRRLKTENRRENFSVENSEWTQAWNLKAGDITLTASGDTLEINSIEVDTRGEKVYNFEVEDFHTYFVGETGVWVHNADYNSISMGTRELNLNYTQNGKDISGRYLQVVKDENGYSVYQDKENGSVLTLDKNGNMTRYYADRYGNRIEEDMLLDGVSLTDKKAMRINGREMTEGSIVQIDKTGKMIVTTPDEMAKVKNGTAFVNGMNMRFEAALDAAHYLREGYKMNSNLYLYYNGTNGMMHDMTNVAIGQQSQIAKGYEKAQDNLRDAIKSGQMNTVYSYSQGSVITGNAFQQAAKNLDERYFYDNKKWISIGGGHVPQNIPSNFANVKFYTNIFDTISNGAPTLSGQNTLSRNAYEAQNGRTTYTDSSCKSVNPLACHSIYAYDWIFK
ncbi:polymorphic toxin-type HINT domain-containing protein [Leptospira perolatii]|nr:polymorphic toxin-type HINT domain-containing protein [Leptospira perolatii]